jgi:WD40 repeat protein
MLLASGSPDETYKLWEVSSGRLIHSSRDIDGKVYAVVAFSPNGKMLASGTMAGRIQFWSTAAGNLLATFVHYEDGNWIAYTPDNNYHSSAGAAKYVSWRDGDPSSSGLKTGIKKGEFLSHFSFRFRLQLWKRNQSAGYSRQGEWSAAP